MGYKRTDDSFIIYTYIYTCVHIEKGRNSFLSKMSIITGIFDPCEGRELLNGEREEKGVLI